MSRRAFGFFLLAVAPVLTAIGSLPYFVTQDGPAHFHSAQLLARLLANDAWTAAAVHAQDFSVPNWLAQLMLALLGTFLPGRVGDQLMMTIAFAGFAASIVWLRFSVRGEIGIVSAIPFAAAIALGRLWLLGFYGFLLGATLFCLILGWWWRARERVSVHRSFVLAGLLVVAWYAHLVSYGVTLFGLALFTWSEPRMRSRRLLYTFAAAIPSLLLAARYASEMAARGSFAPYFLRIDEPSIREWLQHVRSIKPFSIARLSAFPFVANESPLFFLLAPAVLIVIAAIVWTFGMRRAPRTPASRSWAILAAILLLGGLAAPDSFGADHGEFLRERIFLLGSTAAAVAWPLLPSRATRIATALAALALAVQSGFVWEYALRSHREVGRLMRAHAAIPDRSRVFVVHPRRDERFKGSPTLHAANLLGIDRQLVIWNNYQANIYYFPVNFHRPFIPCSIDGTCELRENGDRIDVVVFWDIRPSSDHVVRGSFERRIESAELAVYERGFRRNRNRPRRIAQ